MDAPSPVSMTARHAAQRERDRAHAEHLAHVQRMARRLREYRWKCPPATLANEPEITALYVRLCATPEAMR